MKHILPKINQEKRIIELSKEVAIQNPEWKTCPLFKFLAKAILKGQSKKVL